MRKRFDGRMKKKKKISTCKSEKKVRYETKPEKNRRNTVNLCKKNLLSYHYIQLSCSEGLKRPLFQVIIKYFTGAILITTPAILELFESNLNVTCITSITVYPVARKQKLEKFSSKMSHESGEGRRHFSDAHPLFAIPANYFRILRRFLVFSLLWEPTRPASSHFLLLGVDGIFFARKLLVISF